MSDSNSKYKVGDVLRVKYPKPAGTPFKQGEWVQIVEVTENNYRVQLSTPFLWHIREVSLETIPPPYPPPTFEVTDTSHDSENDYSTQLILSRGRDTFADEGEVIVFEHHTAGGSTTLVDVPFDDVREMIRWLEATLPENEEDEDYDYDS
jgi:hypothetical protein